MATPPHPWTYEQVCDALAAARADEVIVRVGTSGSTGTPKIACLTAAALTASASSTLEVLGGPGQWLLATPATHIAGIQVLVRSALAGVEPVTMPPGSFDPHRVAESAARLAGSRRYTALVPTQVQRLLADPAGRRALASFDAVLVGGAGMPAIVRAAAREAGAHLVATYGMSETAGGCVYDGIPLPVTRMRVTGPDSDGIGIVELAGATLAQGYAGDPTRTRAAFVTDSDGQRWFRTDDLGRIEDGVLSVLGRRDDMINTGGLKIAPQVVEAALEQARPDLGVPGVSYVVLATPDPQWGEAVTVAMTAATAPDLAGIRSSLRGLLPPSALPTAVVQVDHIPLLGSGKPDRRALRETAG